ncbi:Two-component sensor histidine kinase [Legionella busanensis]|uniref:histidine kinase n=1 Tax=Legionella busanensis TaxID=190655 RepID=A0A378JN02_9GAMM|nr:ATP-binding protein [Legionella busanensis]STX52068.1 Two-component sensor histidine kinase [Legionella busanensis]
MSIRHKILLSMFLVVMLFVPVNLYLLTKYLDVKKNFLIFVDSTVPRLESLLRMQNLNNRINLFIENLSVKFQQTAGNTNTPDKVGAVKDEFLSLLEELGEQAKNYSYYHHQQVDVHVKRLTNLRDEVMISALNVFSAKEQKQHIPRINDQETILQNKGKQLNHYIDTLLLQESANIDDEREKINLAARHLTNLTLFLNLIIILVIVILSFFLAKIISNPLIYLSQFAKNIDYDNLEPLLPILSQDEIGELQEHLNRMLLKLDKAKTTLIETSRSAGVAEIATSILHNVGNVLNSINTSVALLTETNQQSSIAKLPKLLDLLEKNKNNLDYFLAHDERGKVVMPYFKGLIEKLENEKVKRQEELENLDKNLTHVNQLIIMQQESSRPGVSLLEPIELTELIEDILPLFANRLRKVNINVERQFKPLPSFLSVKNKIQQILINLIKNAIDSLAISNKNEKRLVIRLELLTEKRWLEVIIKDNGIGIAKEDLQKIFSFGFTTKSNGHGYGLHNCALLAIDLGGELKVESKGINQGANFTLSLPLEKE